MSSAQTLPTPSKTRWQPLRGGLLNLYLYDDEQFVYEQGRLLLRGNNGTGKSRVLALQLPFLLDGEVQPHRVEPDGDSAKRMEWHLLMGGKYPDRTGYTWMELGRVTEDGSAEYRTIGIGMQAVQGRGAPTRWYFVTPQRIGVDLKLMSDTRVPLTKARLAEALKDGELFTRAQDYREALDRAFFQLGRRRYAALLDVLIQLRKPQLSRQLDEKQLSEALSNALPPLSEEVIGDVAEAFRSLENDRGELETFAHMSDAVGKFMKSYRRYARIAARRHADRLRSAHGRYEQTMRDLRGSETELEVAVRERDEAAQRLADLERRADDAATEVRVLETSDAMRDAERLDLARRDAKRLDSLHEEAKDRARRSHEDLERAQNERKSAEDRVAASRKKLCGQGADLRTRASHTGLEPEWAPIDEAAHDLVDKKEEGFEQLVSRGDRLEALLARFKARTDKRVEHIDHLEKEKRRLGDLERSRDSARQELGHVEQELDHAKERFAQAEKLREEELEKLLADYERWCEGLLELQPERPDLLGDILWKWCRSDSEESPITGFVQGALTQADRELTIATQRELSKKQQQTERLAECEAELDEALLGRHEPPPAPHARAEGCRDGRLGAPLWAACDFAGDIGDEERRGYEAALEASGLLDAWITPDGELLGDEVLDSCLLPAGTTPPGKTLAEVLAPAIDEHDEAARPLDEAAIRAVLERIGAAPDASPVWVGPDGRFRLGPLHGRWTKETAEHIGHAAREDRRRRRIAELQSEIVAIELAVERLDAQIEELETRRVRARSEFESAPSDRPLLAASDALTRAEDEVGWRREALERVQQKVRSAEERVRTALEALREQAEELGLEAHLEDLDALRTGTVELRAGLPGFVDQAGVYLSQRRALEESAARQGQAEQRLERCRQEERSAEAERRRAVRRCEVLEQTVGARVEEVLARLEEARARRRELDRARDAQAKGEREADRRVVQAETLRDKLETELDERTEARDKEVGVFKQLASTRTLSIADPRFDEPGDPDDWSATKCVEVARAVEQSFRSVESGDNAWDSEKGKLHTRIAELQAALGSQGWHTVITERGEVRIITVHFQGSERALDELDAILSDELEQRERILAEKERQIIENHLIEDVSAQLHEHLRRGEELVHRMKEEIQARPTSTGMRLRLDWVPLSDGPPGWIEARRRLLSTQSVWSPGDRAAIGEFLHRRIDDERASKDVFTWRELLFAALDYRKWHEFSIYREQDGTWRKLTRRTHGTGSGGEKAIALTMPQLAAAAAHYAGAAPCAPRLILLDEAFVGVDREMRGQCMGLLESFDLDFVMTSEREWGCYSTLSALAIYQLTRQPGIDAIHTTRWMWNGKERLEGDLREQVPA